MPQLTDDEILEAALEQQIPEAQSDKADEPGEAVEPEVTQPEVSDAAKYIGTKLNHMPGDSPYADKEGDKKMIEEKKLSRIGEKIGERAEIRDGWIDVDRALLGQRAIFYPEDWTFRIRPATVEAIRNWSTIDDENFNSVDEVFNEILKSCLSIVTPTRNIPWGNVNSWDRFFFLLLIREYTFSHGESKIAYDEYCPNCDNPVPFELTSQSLMYEYPDEEIMKYYSQEERTWYIDPQEYDVDEPPIKLYIPTLERDAAIKEWMIAKMRENQNAKFDRTFMLFIQWLAPKISKDETIAKKQIRELEMKFKSWDIEMFTFMKEVLDNITVTLSQKLIVECPTCGEEVTADIRFPNSISDLFNVQGKHRKFGKK